MTRFLRSVVVAMLMGAVHAGPAAAQPASASRVTAAGGAIELTDPAGDVQPLVYRRSVGNGPEQDVKYPGFDIVKLAVSSDGRLLTFAATLTAPPARAAYEVIEFDVDADNNAKTGITFPGAKGVLAGLEFHGALEACLESETFGTTCAGTEDKPAGHTAIVTLEKYGTDWMFKDTLLDIPAAGAVKEPRKSPISGAVVQATVDYASMGLKPGQTIRLIIREFSTGKIAEVPQGYFPEILLTLK